MLRRIGRGPGAGGGLPLTHFEGFPYLVTPIVSALYHIILLPDELGRRDLEDVTRSQVGANRLKACLILGEGEPIYFKIDGTETRAALVPEASFYCANRLRKPVDYPQVLCPERTRAMTENTKAEKNSALAG